MRAPGASARSLSTCVVGSLCGGRGCRAYIGSVVGELEGREE